MATQQISGFPLGASGVLGVFYDTAKLTLGSVLGGVDSIGAYAEYVLLAGVASTAVGSVVNYNHLGITALVDSDTAATTLGFMAVALCANIVATTYAWYAITGTFPTSLVANCAADVNLYSSSTGGALDDAKVADQEITGIMSRVATTGAAVVNCQLNRPFGGVKMS